MSKVVVCGILAGLGVGSTGCVVAGGADETQVEIDSSVPKREVLGGCDNEDVCPPDGTGSGSNGLIKFSNSAAFCYVNASSTMAYHATGTLQPWVYADGCFYEGGNPKPALGYFLKVAGHEGTSYFHPNMSGAAVGHGLQMLDDVDESGSSVADALHKRIVLSMVSAHVNQVQGVPIAMVNNYIRQTDSTLSNTVINVPQGNTQGLLEDVRLQGGTNSMYNSYVPETAIYMEVTPTSIKTHVYLSDAAKNYIASQCTGYTPPVSTLHETVGKRRGAGMSTDDVPTIYVHDIDDCIVPDISNPGNATCPLYDGNNTWSPVGEVVLVLAHPTSFGDIYGPILPDGCTPWGGGGGSSM